MYYFAIGVTLLIAFALLFTIVSTRKKPTCPNGHTKDVRRIHREPRRFQHFESLGGGGSGGGHASTRVQFETTFRCGKCGEQWTRIEYE